MNTYIHFLKSKKIISKQKDENLKIKKCHLATNLRNILSKKMLKRTNEEYYCLNHGRCD